MNKETHDFKNILANARAKHSFLLPSGRVHDFGTKTRFAGRLPGGCEIVPSNDAEEGSTKRAASRRHPPGTLSASQACCI